MTDLTDNLRACAAYIARIGQIDTPDENVTLPACALNDAVKLMCEAADTLEKPVDLGEPMEIIKPAPVPYTEAARQQRQQYLLPNGLNSLQQCPECRAPTAKTIRHVGKTLTLTCQVCGTHWAPQASKGQWI